MHNRWQRRRGFTLIEVLIVIVVIAVLASIVIPKLMGAAREAKEANLRSTLQQFRSSVALFRSHTGLYPAQLADLQAPGNSSPANGLDETGASLAINPQDYQGPYVSPNSPTIPRNAVTGGNVEGVDWLYNTTAPDVAGVHAAAGAAVDGSDYSAW